MNTKRIVILKRMILNHYINFLSSVFIIIILYFFFGFVQDFCKTRIVVIEKSKWIY